jgi:putative hemolysin
MNALLLPSVLFFIALFFRAVFAFLETSITALRLFKIRELADSNKHYRQLFYSLEHHPHRVLIAILIASSFADVSSAALATYIAETLFAYLHLSGSIGFSVGIAFATLAILIFGEILPKNSAKNKSDRLLRSGLWLVNIVYFIFTPLVLFLLKFSNYMLTPKDSGRQMKGGNEWGTSEKEILFLIQQMENQGSMSKEKKRMLQSIFHLSTISIKDIMIPATDVISIDAHCTVGSVRQVFVEHYFTRLPVYEHTIDNIIGMVYLKDVLSFNALQETKSVKNIIRPILFVPETMKADCLLQELRQKHLHLAIVLNEHGSVIGLTTIEDILEEIVGDISDEHEPTEDKIFPLAHGGWLANGNISLQDLEHSLNTTFQAEASTTLAGFLTEQLQHVPKKGERILYKDFYLQVQRASSKRVFQVLIFSQSQDISMQQL